MRDRENRDAGKPGRRKAGKNEDVVRNKEERQRCNERGTRQGKKDT